MFSFDELATVENRKALIGKKAESLLCLREGGFNVPDGFIVTTDEEGVFSDGELEKYADANCAYAVRSSGTSEDLADSSFAGLYDTFLNVKGFADLRKAIEACFLSIQNERLVTYAQRNNIAIDNCKMAVIVQHMVQSEKSGVGFSLDSINGVDKEVIIEAVSGLGDQLVSGHTTPDYYSYNWYDERFVTYNGGVLSQSEVKELAQSILDVQVLYGFPVDVEWAIVDGEIYILQSRPITTFSYQSISDEWTTADFRDGGVSSNACKALMGSLYGLVFSDSFLNSLKTIKLLQKTYNNSIYRIFFARPYWNLSIEKSCFSKLPGYIEREIDEDMGVSPTYEGDGRVTRTNPRSLISGLAALSAVNRHINTMEKTAEERLADLLDRFKEVENMDVSDKTADELHAAWLKFVKNDYYLSEYTYFSYIFCNMILSTLFKDVIKKFVPTHEITNLMIGLSDISHMRPIYEMWDMSRKDYSEKEFGNFIAEYMHHSQHELDISYPNWDETPEVVREMITDFAKLDKSQNPRELGEKQKQKYNDTLAKVPEKLLKDVEQLRRFLWLREEFRDISTRSYYLIRKLTLALGKAWENEGILDSSDDIFFLTIADIEQGAADRGEAAEDAGAAGAVGAAEDAAGDTARAAAIKDKAAKNRKYWRSFINFKNPNEIGGDHASHRRYIDGAQILKGVPCGGENITATARVIKDIHNTGRLQQGDILVTKCTDPAWTTVFSKVSGVITETGGLLSHTAVVSREYGIACVLMAKNATEIIRDGDVITMDCHTGFIYKNEVHDV